jgi:hypothetical protein
LTLPDYLDEVARRPFKPGSLDCAIFMADWIMRVTGRDPIADKRGAYSTADQYRELLKAEGGIVKACHARALATGLHETDNPKAGDPMLVNAPIEVGERRVIRIPVGAICVSDAMRAVVTIDRGLVIAGADVLPTIRAWTF